MLSIAEKIVDHIADILEERTWTTMTAPTIHKALTLWDPSTQTIPLITVLPRIESASEDRYGQIECELPVEITAIVPVPEGESAMIGLQVAKEIQYNLFRVNTEGDALEGYPEEATGMRYVDGGIISYPDELNPQMLTAGITVMVKYETDTNNPYQQEQISPTVGRFSTTATIKGDM